MRIDLIEQYQIHPHIAYLALADGRVEISLPLSSKRLRVASNIAFIIKGFSPTLIQAKEAFIHPLGLQVFATLVKYMFILPADEIGFLSSGVSVAVKYPAGCPMDFYGIDDLIERDVVLLHAPLSTSITTDLSVAGGGRRVRSHLAQMLAHPNGLKSRPGVLLDADFGESLALKQLRLFDLGDIVFQPTKDNVDTVGKRVSYLIQKITSQGAYPVILGGDHTLAYYSIQALSHNYPKLGVMQFDAHSDLYSVGAACDEQLNHANVMHWVRRMQHVQSLWQIGIRDVFHQPTEGFTLQKAPRIQTLSAYEAETAGYARMYAALNPNVPWFISFDVDVLAGSEPPDTATPVLGGLNFYSILSCFEYLFSHYRIIGMEFVEIGDAAQGAHGASAVVARLISRFLFSLRQTTAIGQNLYIPGDNVNSFS
ncbi:arginase family protein [Sodalis sp. dw_96]|uniref:arginase family protein n=1 Tax=Sodalis sp. dw_96 TaxID=2719794 RepID=UPI001C49E512|nr:arginase family protein [Sodalis sp. dw_96]